MKVLQINATYGYSSTGLIVKDIGDMLTGVGGEAFYAYQSCIGTPVNGYRVGSKLDWKLHAGLCRAFGNQGNYSRAATAKLLKYIDEAGFDIVHLHNLHSNYVNVPMLLKHLAKRDIATVITMHDCWFFTGKCFHYVDVGCDAFTHGCKGVKCPKKNAPPKSIFFDKASTSLARKASLLCAIPRLALVGCSDWICNEARKSLLGGHRIERIYNGVNIEIFKPLDNKDELRKKYGLENKFAVMGMANKWLLPENAQMVKKVSELENTVLMIVGCTDEQKKYLSDIAPNVLPIEFVRDRDVLAELYNVSNVFVNLTHADTLPTVNMESICCGTPVITYDSCGSPELVPPECGLIVREGDEDGIIGAIKQLQGQPFENCVGYGKATFDKDNCYKKYLDIYNSMLDEKGRLK